MITVDEIAVRLELGAEYIVDTVANEFPLVNLAKPMVKRVIKNSTDKFAKYCNMLADAEGNVDFEGIVKETFESAFSGKPFTILAGSLGDIEIGNNKVKFPMPFTDKIISFGLGELDELKKILTK